MEDQKKYYAQRRSQILNIMKEQDDDFKEIVKINTDIKEKEKEKEEKKEKEE